MLKSGTNKTYAWYRRTRYMVPDAMHAGARMVLLSSIAILGEHEAMLTVIYRKRQIIKTSCRPLGIDIPLCDTSLVESQDDEEPGPVVPYSGTRCPFCSDRGNSDCEGRNRLLQRPWKIISFVARSRTTSETRLTTYWNLQRRDSMSNCGMLRNQRSLWILSC